LNKSCPFCRIIASDETNRIIKRNDQAILIRDGYPVSEGHSLIIPNRHIASFFEATDSEREAILTLIDEAKAELDKEYDPAGYNIGINDGLAAGQTVAHLHIHLIPRYEGDVEDPRGGIRWIIPDKAKYWE